MGDSPVRLEVGIGSDAAPKKPVPLPEGKKRFVIGRGRSADLMIPDPALSRKHCEIVREDVSGALPPRLALVDLDSANGTFLNGKKLTA